MGNKELEKKDLEFWKMRTIKREKKGIGRN
jgi:hypothetical protein